MFTIDPRRTKAYSSDLRWRMVHQRCMLGLPYRKIAENLNVDYSTVYRTVKLFEDTGSVDSIQGFHENTSKKLDPHDEMVILEAVLDCPFMYLHELQNMLLQATGTNVSTATICKFLHSQGFSHKKLAFRAQQRSDELRAPFASDICLNHTFVYVDETGSDKHSLLRKYGYHSKAQVQSLKNPLVRGRRHSAIAAMCMDGVIDVQLTTESVNGETFCD